METWVLQNSLKLKFHEMLNKFQQNQKVIFSDFSQNLVFQTHVSIFYFHITLFKQILEREARETADICRKYLAQVAMRAGDGFDGRAVIAAAKWYGGCRP